MADIRLKPGQSLSFCCSPLASDFGDPRDFETGRKLRAWMEQDEKTGAMERMAEAECRRQYP